MSRILIAEDVPQVSRFLERGLRADGHVTAVAEDGEHALQLAASADFDLLLLDLGLPIRDGHSVLAELRRRRAALPVIVLTARDDPHDVVASFDGGAADYMSKPFGLAELLARIQLRLATTHQRPEAAVLRHGDLALNLRSRVLEIGGDPVALSSREFALAAAFLSQPHRVLSREQLLSEVWGYDHDPSSNVVEVYIRYLRNKIGGSRIRTVRGAGYRLADPSSPDPGCPHRRGF